MLSRPSFKRETGRCFWLSYGPRRLLLANSCTLNRVAVPSPVSLVMVRGSLALELGRRGYCFIVISP